ncbi:MAG TPA: fimbrial biogenesis outer membrane usher protein, partial [Anaeromyxobacteraceae bacterium]|nr:fimbrial biogenesis outer membrane usher protein [Anaeromyxobacteraceae bacterium]
MDVIVNAIPGETTLVYVAPDGDVWVPVAEIARTLRVENAGVQRDHDGIRFVSLRSLEPDLRFELDETALAVRVTAGPAFTGQSRLDLRSSKRPPGLMLHPATSAFLNYGVQGAWDDRSGAPLREGQLSASTELGLSRGTALFLTSATRRNDGEVVRGLSTLTWERPERLLRLGAGDLVASGDGLGGSAILLGVGIAHDLALDPYLVRAPLPSSTTFAATPSVLEVWVN